MRIAQLLACVMLFVWSASCGTRSDDEIPPALLAAIRAGQGSAADYPDGPYGGDVGDVARDVCIQAWHNPREQSYDPNALERVCLSDYYDPSATEHSLLLVNTSAIWCQACRSEYGGSGSRPSLGEEARERRSAGLRVLGALFQGSEREPATVDEAVLWARTFRVDFGFGLDATFAMGAFADPVLQPFNMVIDTRTMRIVQQVSGDEPEVLWPAIDSLLEE